MCGIVGYIGERQAADVLVKGLSRLEYRGYDSAGVAVVNGSLEVRKKTGKVSALSADILNSYPKGQLGIGHTRWATHGAPNDTNAHPHVPRLFAPELVGQRSHIFILSVLLTHNLCDIGSAGAVIAS